SKRQRQPAGHVVQAVPAHSLHLVPLPDASGTTESHLEVRAHPDYRRASLRASNEADQSSARNSSSVAIASSANMCSTTPISRSLWNGTSTCGCETRLSDRRRQLGQRTASPTVPSVAVSSVNEDGKTGRGCSSG